MKTSELLCVAILLLAGTEARRYPRRLDYNANNCPLQCRCMELSVLGSRGLDQNWQNDDSGDRLWRGTDAPPINGSNKNIQGSDVVCTGLGQVPWPLPDGMFVVCLFFRP